jgi:serine/threonine protein kinase/WD40 repeat protein
MTTLAELLDALRRWHLLEPAQLETLTRQWGQRHVDPRAAAKKLVEQGWLTRFQANQLFRGRGWDLLLGSYVLLELLGEGGMGAVYKARNWKLGQIVAVKLIRRERLTNPAAVRRFQREIRASAHLDHPNIVRALDADEVGGTHLLVMEYVAGGQDLHKLVRAEGRLSVEQACRFIQQAALGLQHAFERGLVHRDIKPHNLLRSLAPSHSSLVNATRATRQGLMTKDEGLIKILDFGLARLGEADDDSSTLTQEGSVMGTLDYLAPEQARDSHTADIRSDLYSLGCTTYFLLTGQAPFPGGSVTEKMFKHQFNQPMPLIMLRPDVPDAVADIVDKLMAKRPEERYQTPAELAVDLEAFLAGRTVTASSKKAQTMGGSVAPEASQETQNPFAGLGGSETAGDAIAAPVSVPVKPPTSKATGAPNRRPVRRLMVMAGGGLAGFVVLLVALVVLFNRPAPPGSPSEPKVVPKRPQPPNILDLAAAAEKERQAQEAAERKKRAEEQAARQKWIDQEQAIRARRAAEAEEPFKTLTARHKKSGSTFGSIARDVAAFRAKHGGTPAAIRAAALLMALPSPLDQLDPAKLPEDAQAAWKASGSADNDVAAVLGTHRGRHWSEVTAFAVSPDLKWLASTTGQGRVSLWRFDTLEPVRMLNSRPVQVLGLAFSPDSRRLATAGGGAGDDSVKIWEVATGKLLATVGEPGKGFGGVSWSRDGLFLAATQGSDVCVLDAAEAKILARMPSKNGNLTALSIAPDGARLATSTTKTITVWNWRQGKATPFRTLEADDVVWDVAMLDAQTLAVAYQSGKQSIWRLEDEPHEEVLCPTGAHRVAGSPTGKRVAVSHYDGRVVVWDLQGPKAIQRHEFKKVWRGSFRAPLQFANERVLVRANRGSITAWDMDTGEELTPPSGSGAARHVRFNSDLTHLAASYADGSARVWDHREAIANVTVAGLHAQSTLAVSPDGDTMACVDAEGIPGLWSLTDGKKLRRLSDSQASIWTFMPDGSGIVASAGRNVQIFPMDPALPIKGYSTLHEQGITGLALTPDGAMALTCCWGSGTLRLIDLETGAEERRYFDGEQWDGQGVAIAPDGRRAAAWLRSGGVKLFDLLAPDESSAITLDLNSSRDGRPIVLSFSPDSKFVATVDGDDKVLLYDAGAGRRLRAWQFPGPVSSVAFADDGRHLATANGNGTIYILRIPPPPKALTAGEAKQHQQDAAKKLGVPVDIENSIGIKLRLIPPGGFLMGDAGLQVTMSRPYYVGVHEVTQAQYEKITGKNPSHFHKGNGGGPGHPVETLSWEDAVAFCQMLSDLPEEKKAGRVYRLPTDAEWEYACRAGTVTAYSFGDDPKEIDQYAWYFGNAGDQTKLVGLLKPNAWGLHDMHGNVWEFVAEEASRGGGGFNHPGPEAVCATARGGLGRTGTLRDTGFRVVCEIAAPRTVRSGDRAPGR